MEKRALIYQLLPRYWGSHGTEGADMSGHFSDIDKDSLEYLHWLGVTHVWYMGVLSHSTLCGDHGCTPSNAQFVKGEAGSPFAIRDYFDVNAYMADNPSERMSEFESLIKRTHEAGLKVLIDFVPNHVSRDNVNLGHDDDKSVHWSPDNDFYYYPGEALRLPGEGDWEECPARASGNCFSSAPSVNDWYETVKINYCDFHTGTWDKMYEIVRFWALKGVDGFRCDMVELVPPQFMKWLIAKIREEFPHVIFVGEVYDFSRYGEYAFEVGFDLLYDKSGLYDRLREIVEGRGSAEAITANWQALSQLQDHMLNFLENHDEQRVASTFFAGRPQSAYAALAVSALFNNASFMLYFGEEVGERGMYEEGFSGLDGRNTIFDWWTIDSIRRLRDVISSHAYENMSINELKDTGLSVREAEVFCRHAALFRLAAREPAFSAGNYDLGWCNSYDRKSVFAFLRYDADSCFLVVCNFSDRPATLHVEIPEIGKIKAQGAFVRIPAHDFSIKEISF